MKNPFQYGKVAEKENFIDRDIDRMFLKQTLYSGTNVILVSPRRWGKSSVVKQAMSELCNEQKDVRVCYIDAFPITSSAEFYKIFAQKVLNATCSQVQSAINSIGKFLKSVSPKISFSPEPMSEFSISLDISGNGNDESEVLNLPEMMAKERGMQVIVCIDEFQQLARLSDYARLESMMRSVWQHQQHVAYCLYGSQRHMMEEIFNSTEKPFFRFGQVYNLKKIEGNDWKKYIIDRFSATGKSIDEALAEKIVDTVDRHSWYVQQLSSAVWNFTGQETDTAAFKKALEWCVDVNSDSYRKTCENLPETQLNLLRAIAADETQLSSSAVVKRYRLGSSASVTKNKRILSMQDIIDIHGRRAEFQDPLFRLWFKEVYCG